MIEALKKIGLWLGVTLLLLLAGAVWVMIGYTLVNPWVFFGCVFILSLVLTGLWKQLGSLPKILDRPTPDFAIVALIIVVVLSGIVLGVNYFTADFSGEEATKALVVRKYQKTRHRSRRSGRHSYERGEPYQVYFVDLRLLDGKEASESEMTGKASEVEKSGEASGGKKLREVSEEKYSGEASKGKKVIEVELNRKTYGRVHKGDTATVSISRGVFGMPVLSPSTLRPVNPRKPTPSRRKGQYGRRLC